MLLSSLFLLFLLLLTIIFHIVVDIGIDVNVLFFFFFFFFFCFFYFFFFYFLLLLWLSFLPSLLLSLQPLFVAIKTFARIMQGDSEEPIRIGGLMTIKHETWEESLTGNFVGYFMYGGVRYFTVASEADPNDADDIAEQDDANLRRESARKKRKKRARS